MATAGPKSPSTTGTSALAGSSQSWTTSHANITASDDTRATTANLNQGQWTDYLTATGFGFTAGDIPANAAINGITVEWECSASAAAQVTDKAARIIKAGAIGSTDKSSATQYPLSVGEAYISHGGAADLWGESWAAADIHSPTFGAALASQNTGAVPAAPNVDHVRITVDYTVTVGGLPFASSVTRNAAIRRM